MPLGRQLSPSTRGMIEALHEEGQSLRKIADRFGRSKTAVEQCVKRLASGSSDYETRPGRGKATIAREDNIVKRMAVSDRRKSSSRIDTEVNEQLGKEISGRTVRRRLHQQGIDARRPRKKPELTKRHRPLRLNWAVSHRDCGSEEWKSVLFSDESKVSIGSDGVMYVWRRKDEEFLPECCDRAVQHPISVRVWGSMSWNGVGSLICLDERVDSAAYQRILEDHMLQDADHLIGDEFVF